MATMDYAHISHPIASKAENTKIEVKISAPEQEQEQKKTICCKIRMSHTIARSCLSVSAAGHRRHRRRPINHGIRQKNEKKKRKKKQSRRELIAYLDEWPRAKDSTLTLANTLSMHRHTHTLRHMDVVYWLRLALFQFSNKF